jgi:hypothetical protein
MPGVRTSMRKIREVLRLRASGLTVAEIARSLGIAAGTAWTYATRLKAAGLTWPPPPDLDDAALERLIYPPPPHSGVHRPEPDWPAIHRELKRPEGIAPSPGSSLRVGYTPLTSQARRRG